MKSTVKILGFTFGLMLSWQSVHAKTILISDMDDTIKNSHVLSPFSTVFNTYQTNNVVMGMNKAYQALATDNKDLQVKYLSNAPDFIMMGFHQKLITKHQFPEGELLMRSYRLEEGHKINNIDEIVRRENPDLVILIGDNGEHDIDIYNQAVRNHPNTKFITYIHMLYYTGASKETGKQIKEGQNKFATSLDLVLSLLKEGQVTAHSAGQFVQSFALALSKEPKMESDGILAFPRWMDCRDVSFDESAIELLPTDTQSLAKYTLAQVKSRCSVPRYQY